MNTQTFAQVQDFKAITEVKAITDEELMAVNGGIFWGPGGGVAGGIMQGAAANRVGVQLDAGSAGVGAPASVGRMLVGQ